MSGRAGRRGLDDRGIVIQMIDEKMEPHAAKDILKGTADPLNSAFHLGYNMLLNLLRVEGADPERMMQLSFHQFQSERAAPAMQSELEDTFAQRDSIAIEDEPAVAEYHQLSAGLAAAEEEVRAVWTRPQHIAPFVQEGRLMRVRTPRAPGSAEAAGAGAGAGADAASSSSSHVEWGWGPIVGYSRRPAAPANAIGAAFLAASGAEADAAGAGAGAGAGAAGKGKSDSVLVVDVLLPVRVDAAPAAEAGGKGKGGKGGWDRDREREKPLEVFSPAPGFATSAGAGSAAGSSASSSSSAGSAAAAGGAAGRPGSGKGGKTGGKAAGGAGAGAPASSAAAAAGAGAGSADGSERIELRVVPVVLPAVAALSSIRVYLPKDLRQADERAKAGDRLKEVHRRFPTGLPLMNPVEDMAIHAPELKEALARRDALVARIAASPIADAADRDARLAAYGRKLLLDEKASFLRGRIKAATALVMRDTLRNMKRVLRRLGHLSADNVVQTKGRVACEINTADELLVTELIFSGAFNDLDAGQAVSCHCGRYDRCMCCSCAFRCRVMCTCVSLLYLRPKSHRLVLLLMLPCICPLSLYPHLQAALLSCMVFSEKGDDDAAAKLPDELAAPFRTLQAAARRIAEVSLDCKIEMDAEEYVSSFKSEMMPLVFAWVNGAKFVDIMGMTTQFEGSIIRVIRRLEELCRQLGDAAKAIGDEGLERKFKEASAKMRRDIIFAASLYL